MILYIGIAVVVVIAAGPFILDVIDFVRSHKK